MISGHRTGNRDLFAEVPLDQPGTPTRAWTRAAHPLPRLDLGNIEHVLLVVAHPDDECLGPGGLVHALTTRGSSVTVVIVSGGEQSHAHDPAVVPLELSALRQAESVAAARILGTEAPIFLGFPDGGVESHTGAIVGELEHVLHRVRADHSGALPTVVTHWRGDGHPDHEAVGRCAAEAAQSVVGEGESLTFLEFPLWALHWDSPDSGQFPISAAAVGPDDALRLQRKRQAAHCFTSQVARWPDEANGPVMPEHVIERLLKAPELLLSTSLSAASHSPCPVDGLDHLQRLYAEAQDPWDLETSEYEKAKRRATLQALPRDRYRLCFEAGSSIGVLTADLAQRADRVIGWEPVERAAATARARILDLETAGTVRPGTVSIEDRALSALNNDLGPLGADLIVLSEVLYFIPHHELAPIVSGLCARAAPEAHLVAVHWTHSVAGWPAGGAGTHEVLAGEPSLRALHRDETSEDYLLEVFQVER
ncbi:bifunctional PIG-L family deacetylase/class I SAM-dependent methyltransferase [Nesterenkonia muleiensis]|uniref:bifunctional PIG-L family deacetylase/class I SAM-dependent methyltransferase n=1 Tax=Nesterenkonia muleiensis TaxID=2282648 RepID=UPI000E740FC1|nr:bifunctional PIG-L family deacetylase/class I SAM-dependent methyltransferase [Nesterenkonia muleiensis]